MTLLIEILQNPGSPPRRRVLPTQLLVRGSTAKANKSRV
jgi:DNA-binding LacI/PurR family transcriptional regulator